MVLTRKQAITEHRKMWNWIADQIIKLRKLIDVYSYKKAYLYRKRLFDIRNNCFLCEYSKSYFYSLCKNCPLDWGYVADDVEWFCPCEGNPFSSNEEEYGLWWKCQKAKTWEEQARIAREIANLPEREIA